MTEPLVGLTFDDAVARITLARPAKRNALTRTLIEELLSAVEQVRSNSTVRLAVLSAAGPAFCAGMDLGEMQQRAGQPDASEQWREDTRVYRELLFGLFTLDAPTLAVVQGPAIAGGLGLVLACDMVLASEEAVFGLPEPKRGITAAVVAPFLIHRVGPGQATHVALSGQNLSAEQALRVGLCHEVVPGPLLSERAAQICDSILSGSPSSLAVTKRHISACAAKHLSEQLDVGMAISAAARESADAREGLKAFLEKRPPSWARPQTGR
jgi:methylglutaconyl-CoA hydratase